MRKQRVFPVWYVCAVNNHPFTNEYIATGICGQRAELARQDVLCSDGRRRNLFICPNGYDDIKTVIDAVASFNLKIDVFVEQTEDIVAPYNLWKDEAKQRRRYALYRNRLARKRSQAS